MDGTKSILTGAVHGTGATGIGSAMALLRLSAEWKQSCLRLRHLSWSGCFRKEKKTAVLNLPRAKGGGFLLHAALPTVVGLTRCPQAFCVSMIPIATSCRIPSSLRFCAALKSLRCLVLHSGHTHSRSERLRFLFWYPQWEHSWVEGKKRSACKAWVPFHNDLYFHCCMTWPNAASSMDFASLVFARPSMLRF